MPGPISDGQWLAPNQLKIPQKIPYRGKLWPINVSQREYPPNDFNQMLGLEDAIWRNINACGGVQALCPGTRYVEPPWVKQPVQGQRYSKISSIALPGVEGTEFTVASFLVPLGYDGVIISTVNEYTGTGFMEGSGDITWRIRLNLRPVKDYGAITTTIGSLQTPYNINSGAIRLLSRQEVTYNVVLGPGALGNLTGGRIICGLFGWYYPR